MFYILLCMRVQAVLVQCSGELLHGPWPGVTGVQLIPPLSQTRISGHLSHNQSVLAITHLPSREDPSSLPPPQEQSRACAAQRLFCSSSPLLALDPKSSNDPWGFLLQVAKEVLDRSPPHLSVSVSARQPFDDDKYRRTSSLSRGSTSESGAISVIRGLHR